MPARIVLFGATGYTGRLTAEALARRGAAPLVLAGRNPQALERLAGELGADAQTAVADVSRPDSVRALVERGDVLVSTVGPFVRWGEPAVQAAISAGAHYLDSTGEAEFVRAVFERHGRGAEAAGCGLVTAFGYDWVPGNLAGALALREAGDAAARVDLAYFFTGDSGMSGGTRASAVGTLAGDGFALRDGRIVTERFAARRRTFDLRGRPRAAVTVGSSEHFALPRLAPGLREVNTYLGWFGPASRGVQAVSLAAAGLRRVPGGRSAIEAVTSRVVRGSTGGPDAAERARGGSHFQAIAYDAAGGELAHVVLDGPEGYELTGDLLAWGAVRAAAGALRGTGALGPVDAFGLDELERGCEECRVRRVA